LQRPYLASQKAVAATVDARPTLRPSARGGSDGRRLTLGLCAVRIRMPGEPKAAPRGRRCATLATCSPSLRSGAASAHA